MKFDIGSQLTVYGTYILCTTPCQNVLIELITICVIFIVIIHRNTFSMIVWYKSLYSFRRHKLIRAFHVIWQILKAVVFNLCFNFFQSSPYVILYHKVIVTIYGKANGLIWWLSCPDSEVTHDHKEQETPPKVWAVTSTLAPITHPGTGHTSGLRYIEVSPCLMFWCRAVWIQ